MASPLSFSGGDEESPQALRRRLESELLAIIHKEGIHCGSSGGQRRQNGGDGAVSPKLAGKA